MANREELKVKRVYSIVRTVCDDAHGNTAGFYGTVTPQSLYKIFSELDVYGSIFVDLGAGKGIPMGAAMALGASKVYGFELPENQANKVIFDASVNRMASKQCFNDHSLLHRAHFGLKDIMKVGELPVGSDKVFSFWVGMQLSAQLRVLDITIRCPTVDKIAVFRDRKWRSPESVLEQLNSLEYQERLVSRLHRVWQHDRTIRTALHGSRERHTAWVFSRE